MHEVSCRMKGVRGKEEGGFSAGSQQGNLHGRTATLPRLDASPIEPIRVSPTESQYPHVMKLGNWDMGQYHVLGGPVVEKRYLFFVSLPRGKLVKAVVGIGQNWPVAVALFFLCPPFSCLDSWWQILKSI